MRVFGFRLPFFVAVIWAGIGSTVWALGYNRGRVETVYVGPATTTLTVPTSYVVSSSWVEPTSYVVASSYATAYVTDPIAVVQPAYVSTAYVRTGLFGRRWLVERPVVASYGSTYLPTAYYVPSTYYSTRSYMPTVLMDPMVRPTSYLTSADCICPERVALATPPSRASSGAATAPRSGAGSKTVQSVPTDELAMPSDVGPAPVEKAPAAAPGASTNAGLGETVATNPQNVSPTTDNSPTPPPAPKPLPPPDQQKGAAEVLPLSSNPQGGATTRQTQPPPAAAVKSQTPANPNATNAVTPSGPPPAPGGDLDAIGPPDTNPPGGTRYQARRPAFSTRPLRSETRNVLFGTVQSSAAGQPEEGVRVSVMNSLDPNRDKATMTDAFGRFSVRLIEGDWTVNVTMPSGRVYPVSRIRVSDGQITDSLGRRVPSLEITR
jgi:hypothetical protein